MRNKGFTLIELLIVIALLGALSVALIAAVDPFEQLKKGNDTKIRNSTSEFYNAVLRYYSTNNTFPWGTSVFDSASSLDTLTDAINTLTSAGELKQNFAKLAGGDNTLKEIFVTSPTTESIRVCYGPQSKSFRAESSNIYDQTGDIVSDGSCPNATSTSCYWCVQ